MEKVRPWCGQPSDRGRLKNSFLLRDVMLTLYIHVYTCPVSVYLSVRSSQAGILSKRLDESSCVLAWRLPSIYPTVLKGNLGPSKNKGPAIWNNNNNNNHLTAVCPGQPG